MDGFSVGETGPLRSPVVVVAFTGWSDTGTVTTDAAQRLIDTYQATRFLDVDPEPYFVFTETRPTAHMNADGSRRIEWPQVEAYAASLPDAPQDLVVVKGVEPNLRWRTFATRLADIVAAVQPSLICTLVARPAATPHTRPVPISGSSADPSLAAKFGLGRSMYQGPTGIVGILHDELRSHGAGLISLAAGVPHYLNVEENPLATAALLRALLPVIGVVPPVDDLDTAGERFLERVEEASQGDDQIRAYVRTLEDHYGEDDGDDAPPADLPSAAELLRDVEDFLRGGNGDS